MGEEMTAIRFHEIGPPEVLRIDRVPVPRPDSGEVLVKVAAAGVNFADTIRRGGHPYPVPTPLPFNPGCEIAGQVVECGHGVDTSLIGASVVALSTGGGGYAEFRTVPLTDLLPVPAGLEAEQALALVVQGLTAYLALTKTARLQPGEVVFVPNAVGGVGSIAVQVAKALGAGLVIAGVGRASKCAAALAIGADVAVDYGQADWPAKLASATAGAGIDVLLDSSAGDLLRSGCSLLTHGGRAVVYGTQDFRPDAVVLPDLIARGASVHGFFLEALRSSDPALVSRALRTLGRMTADGRVKLQIQRFALTEAAEAHRAIESRLSSGKLVLVP